MLERQSALASALVYGGRDGADGRRQLRMGEVRGWTLVQLAAFATTVARLDEAVRQIIGVGLPERVGHATTAGNRYLMKIGSEQYWIISRSGEDLAPRLQASIPSDCGAVTSLSHGRTRMFVEGAAARAVLADVPIDLHPAVFGVGRFALTALHHTPVLVHRTIDSRYELYALRTFAQSVWAWLADAAWPIGYDVVSENLDARARAQAA